MRIAVCFSGMIRTGMRARENQKLFLEGCMDQCDFFLHTWSKQAFRPKRQHIEEQQTVDWEFVPLGHDDLDYINHGWDWTSIKVDNYHKNWSMFTTLGPLWCSWYESIKLKQHHEKLNFFTYDYVIKLRSDLLIRPGIRLVDLIEKIDSRGFGTPDAYKNFRNQMSLEDEFFISNSHVMDFAAEFVATNSSAAYMHNDLYTHLTNARIRVVPLGFAFANETRPCNHGILRPECTHYDPVTQFEHCEECNKRINYPQNWFPNVMSEQEVEELYKKIGYIRDQ